MFCGFYRNISNISLCNMISWPFQNGKNFTTFTATTISFIASRKFSEISYLSSFLIAGSSFLLVKVCQYYSSYNSRKKEESTSGMSGKDEIDPAQIFDLKKKEKKIESLKSYLLFNKEKIEEICNYIADFDEKKENEIQIQQRKLFKLFEYFSIEIEDFKNIFKNFPGTDRQYLNERSAALKKLLEKFI